MRVGLGDDTVVAADQIPAGAYSTGYTDPYAPVGSAANQSGAQLQVALPSSGIANTLSSNSTLIVAACAIVGLLVAMGKK